MEALYEELAPFNIGTTIIEPGGARTQFRFGNSQLGPTMDIYRDTPASRTRAQLQDTSRLPIGDPSKMVKIIIDSVDQCPAPRRIALGSDSYRMIHKALTERLGILEGQKSLAFSTDFPVYT
jgi:hypothetical protein